jgi:hypothetical protein
MFVLVTYLVSKNTDLTPDNNKEILGNNKIQIN